MPKKDKKTFVPEPNGNQQAIDLLKQVVGLNNGVYLDKEIINGSKTNFCMGVAGYPEKHFEAQSMEFDLQRAKEKVDTGAQYIMTQMFFNNKKYFEYVDACRSIGINVPIIPGLKPITNKKQLTILPNIFYVDIPTDLSTAMLAATTDEACEQVGTEWLIQQSKELKAAGVPVLHYYTLGKPKVVKDVCKSIF
jgi:methylenetetrahydrofolate reductase (NADPH)